MLYIRVTDKCNMKCAHCAFSCTNKGTFMSEEVFDKCLALATDYGWTLTIGGGEPTLHPKIIDWTWRAAYATVDTYCDNDYPAVLVVTNGKKKREALELAKLGRIGLIMAALSIDPWHDAIDTEVESAFRKRCIRDAGTLEIRDVSRGVKRQGRAAKNPDEVESIEGCACSALCVEPNGDFYWCGCRLTKLGNILTDAVPELWLENSGECERYIREQGILTESEE